MKQNVFGDVPEVGAKEAVNEKVDATVDSSQEITEDFGYLKILPIAVRCI